MSTLRLRAPLTIVLALVIGQLTLPACDKRKDVRGHYLPSTEAESKEEPQEDPPDPTLPQPPGPGPIARATNIRAKEVSEGNLKQIALAFYSCERIHGALPLGIAQ